MVRFADREITKEKFYAANNPEKFVMLILMI